MAVTLNEIATGGVEGAGIGVAGAGLLVPGPTGPTGSALLITDGSNVVTDVSNLTIAGGIVGGTTPNATITVGTTILPNIAALRAYTPTTNGQLVYVEGFTTIGDGGQGFFAWNSSSSLGDDGGTVICPSFLFSSAIGPNLVLNGTFASGSADWTTTSGTPIFGSNQVGRPDGSFWQISQSITGLTVGTSYIVSLDYTLASGSSQYVSAALGVPEYNTSIEATPTLWSFIALATATALPLVLAGQNAANSMTNVTVELAPPGRFLRQVDTPGVCIPEWWGALGNDTGDDAPAINSAIAWATNYASPVALGDGLRGNVKLSPGKLYKCNEILSPINPVAMSMTGQLGSILDFSSVASGACITITGVSIHNANNPYANTLSALHGFGIECYPFNENLVGIGFAGPSEDFVAHLQLEHMYLTGFGIGIALNGNNCYLVGLRRVDIFGCGLCYDMNNPGNSSGEEMVIDDCGLFNSQVAIDLSGGPTVVCINTSLDYCGCFIRNNSSILRMYGCHFETNFFGPTPSTFVSGQFLAPIQCTIQQFGGEITIRDSDFTWTGGAAPPLFYCTVPSPQGISAIDCRWQWPAPNLTVVNTAAGISSIESSGGITVTNNSLTGTANYNFGSYSPDFGPCVFSDPGQISGKWFWNVTLNNITGTAPTGGFVAGFAQWVTDNGEYFDKQGGVVAAVNNVVSPSRNGIYNFGTPGVVAFTPPITNGSVWWFAIDFGAKLFWFSNDAGGHWNNVAYNVSTNSPAAGTGGVNISSLLANLNAGFPKILRPVFSLQTVLDQATFNFNPSTGGVNGLSGFFSWQSGFTLGVGGCVTTERNKTTFEGWPPLLDVTNAINSDPTFEFSSGTSFLDAWYISQDTASITSRNTGSNISIAIGTGKPFNGLQELDVVKIGTGTAGAVAIMLPCNYRDNHTYGIQYAASSNGLGTFNLTVSYKQFLYFGTGGVPVFGKSVFGMETNYTPTTGYQASNLIVTTGINGPYYLNPAPAWATHVIYEFDLFQMSGTLYLDNVQLYRY